MKHTWQQPKLGVVTFTEDVVTTSIVSDTYDWIGADSNAWSEGGLTE